MISLCNNSGMGCIVKAQFCNYRPTSNYVNYNRTLDTLSLLDRCSSQRCNRFTISEAVTVHFQASRMTKAAARQEKYKSVNEGGSVSALITLSDSFDMSMY